MNIKNKSIKHQIQEKEEKIINVTHKIVKNKIKKQTKT